MKTLAISQCMCSSHEPSTCNDKTSSIPFAYSCHIPNNLSNNINISELLLNKGCDEIAMDLCFHLAGNCSKSTHAFYLVLTYE